MEGPDAAPFRPLPERPANAVPRVPSPNVRARMPGDDSMSDMDNDRSE